MQDQHHSWYSIDNIAEVDTPALVVYPDRIRHNIQEAIRMVDGQLARLRPHVKTHKCSEVAQMMMDAGISQFKCATIAEAEMLAKLGAKDVLLAYQPIGPKLERLIVLARQYPATQFGCLMDNEAVLRAQSEAFQAAGLQIDVYLDLNVGMNRTGIVPGAEALRIYQLANMLPGIRLCGLHAYDGHIRQTDFSEKQAACDATYALVVALRRQVVEAGLPSPVMIMSGSPAFSVHCRRADVVCSPGTFIYWDHGYRSICPEQAFLPAAVLVTRVVSLPTATRVCTDLGHKSVAAENELGKRIFFLNAEGLMPVGQSEEHLVLETDAGHGYQPGDVLYGLPYHICPTIALYDKVGVVQNGKVVGWWRNIARDRSLGV